MTYKEMIPFLQSNHFYPYPNVKDEEIVSLNVECSATILMDSRKQRLEEILKDQGVKITKFPNEGYLLIEKKPRQ